MVAPSRGGATDPRARRAWWLKTLHRWHWISSALCLAGMLLFAVTGITLNHSGSIEARPTVDARIAPLPEALRVELAALAEGLGRNADDPLPPSVVTWLNQRIGVRVGGRAAEWSAEEVYLPLPRPGGDAWLRLDLVEAEVEYERTDRGWIAYLNDLHKGRNTGPAWSLFIDVFALACVVFSITGLLILQVHATNRASVWPVVGLGVVVPVLLALLFIH